MHVLDTTVVGRWAGSSREGVSEDHHDAAFVLEQRGVWEELMGRNKHNNESVTISLPDGGAAGTLHLHHPNRWFSRASLGSWRSHS